MRLLSPLKVKKKPLFLMLIIVYILFLICPLRGQAKILIFPFEDLSNGVNGINFEIPSQIAQALKDAGIDVVSPRKILNFLAYNRIRWTGWIDRITAIKAARTYKADLIMIGTVTELNKETPALGVTVRLLRTKDYKVLWTKTSVFSSKEEVSFLSLKRTDFDNIKKQTVHFLVKSLPGDIQKGVFEPPEVEIADVYINPRRVRGGRDLECAVRLDISGDNPDKVYFLWQGYKIAAIPKDGLYVGRWKAPKKEGRYPVNLLLFWSKYGLSKKLFLSTFVVDNTPPKFTLRIVQGLKVDGEIAFNKYIYVLPLFEKSEPISRWSFEILDKKIKRVVLKEERPGPPPLKFIWRGTDLSGHLLPSGKYIIRLKVWDLAGNYTEDKKEILFAKTPPSVSVIAKRINHKLHIIFDVSPHLLPIDFWHLEFWDSKGNLLAEYDGTGKDLKGFFLNNVKSKDRRIFYTLEVRDILGNRTYVKNQPLQTVVVEALKKSKELKRSKKWIEDF